MNRAASFMGLYQVPRKCLHSLIEYLQGGLWEAEVNQRHTQTKHSLAIYPHPIIVCLHLEMVISSHLHCIGQEIYKKCCVYHYLMHLAKIHSLRWKGKLRNLQEMLHNGERSACWDWSSFTGQKTYPAAILPTLSVRLSALIFHF